MGEKELLEIKNLTDDDLLSIYQMIVDHMNYLNSSIIDTSVDEGGETTDE